MSRRIKVGDRFIIKNKDNKEVWIVTEISTNLMLGRYLFTARCPTRERFPASNFTKGFIERSVIWLEEKKKTNKYNWKDLLI